MLAGLLYYRPLQNYLDRQAAVEERRAEVATLAAEREKLARRLRYVESDEANVDAGGKAHTKTTEGHPAGDGERTDREVGGPKLDDDSSES